MKVTIYHNPRCSKSRQTLQLLEDEGVTAEIVEYLKSPPDKVQLKQIIRKLGISARDLVRKKEAEYKENRLDDLSLSEDALIEAMIRFPKLIERPIVVTDKGVALGRPPANVLEVL